MVTVTLAIVGKATLVNISREQPHPQNGSVYAKHNQLTHITKTYTFNQEPNRCAKPHSSLVIRRKKAPSHWL